MNETLILGDVSRQLPTAMMLLEERGKATALQCLAFGKLALGEMVWDNWDGGMWSADLRVLLPPPLYLRLAGDEARRDPDAPLTQLADDITSAMRESGLETRDEHGNPIFFGASLHLAPLRGVDAEAWKAEAIERMVGSGVTNQGRVRSDNLASLEFAGLRFRSQAEVNLFRAFQTLNVLVSPLPVFVRGTGRGSRFEPDFVVVVPPRIIVVEVDGPMHHESPVDAHERLAELVRSGIHVERVRADECRSLASAGATAKRLLRIISDLRQ